jgi:hypothetical protein
MRITKKKETENAETKDSLKDRFDLSGHDHGRDPVPTTAKAAA